MTARRTPDDYIVVLGLSKTGTTGVYASIKDGLHTAGANAITVFEPRDAAILDNLFVLAPNRTVLAKTTMNRCANVLPDPLAFDRRVMTVRDPRDALISSLLFRPITKRSIERTDASATAEFVAALQRKEADPNAISVRELFDLSRRLGIGGAPVRVMIAELRMQQQMLQRIPFHVVRYENFIRGEVRDLATYLGFPVTNVADEDSAQFGHISRARSSGDFLNWFRSDDLEYFDTILGGALDALGYERRVQLPEHQVIDPATSSEYVQVRAHQRRHALSEAQRHRGVPRVDQFRSTDVEHLASLAGNGDPLACLRMAEAELSGHRGTSDELAALGWARTAAQLGLREGMELTIELLSRSGFADPAIHREARAWRNEYQARYTSERRLVEVEGRLDQLRASARYRIGDQFVELARSPWRNGPHAVRELISIWRGRSGRSSADRRPNRGDNTGAK